MHQKFVKDRTCSSVDILMERQTERYTYIVITTLAHPLWGFARRWMYPLLYHASGNHVGHCKPFNTNFSTLVYLQMNHYNSQWLNSSLTVSVVNWWPSSVTVYHTDCQHLCTAQWARGTVLHGLVSGSGDMFYYWQVYLFFAAIWFMSLLK